MGAKVPLANMFQYVSSLRSMSKGRASYMIKESQNTFINLFLRKCSHPTCICYRRQHSSTMTPGHIVWFLRLSFLLLCNHCWFRNCWSFLRSVIPLHLVLPQLDLQSL